MGREAARAAVAAKRVEAVTAPQRPSVQAAPSDQALAYMLDPLRHGAYAGRTARPYGRREVT